ncbi:store-operated calcium entry regulator STIMATE-like isoform X2 [Oratosquilla oratoria]|uniref:store-operated calcium entry regulator STIMATE-like isoform X2 n=1 Tax=Oratosquilla oratoria TaxID=337810 RepID=UPI003F76DBC8
MAEDLVLPSNINSSMSDPSTSPNSVCGKDALTNSYGWFVQAMLASLAFTLLILKRFCEPKKTRRSWLVWFYDTSKQGMGAMVIHFTNVFLAEEFQGDPCTWYIVSFLLDSTVGLIIIWAGIRLCIYIGRKKGYPTMLFGEYGRPPSARAWGHQVLLYLVIMVIEKILITLLMGFDFWTSVRDLILSPISDPQARVVVVVLVIPFFVNALIFWVTDNFLMLKVRPIPRDEEEVNEEPPSSSIPASRSNPKIRYSGGDVHQAGECEGLLTATATTPAST